jgi:formylglycine-generating enzyme required for sulfatase activity
MVAIPGGTFLMGSLATETQRQDWEIPQHQVTVQPFFIGKYPVTQAQWQAVAALPKININLNPNPSCFRGENLPV